MAIGSRVRNRFTLLGFAILSIVGACSLNPQPIPPGGQPGADAGGFGSKTGEDPKVDVPVDDAGSALEGDATTPPNDAGTNFDDADGLTNVDAAADAGDGDADAATTDASSDAPDDVVGD